jgi:hypothetical protein
MNRIPPSLNDPTLSKQDIADILRIETLSRIQHDAYARKLAAAKHAKGEYR